MAIHIAALLDKAQVIHRLPSDYKLALVMGISHSSLTSYRQGKTMPDARVIAKLCELTGDDAGVLLADIEAERADLPAGPTWISWPWWCLSDFGGVGPLGLDPVAQRRQLADHGGGDDGPADDDQRFP